MVGDHTWRYDPPWNPLRDQPTWPPLIPQPVVPMPAMDWPVERLKEYLRLLKEIRELEEKVGCPCEPNKADYIKLFEERIAKLEAERK